MNVDGVESTSAISASLATKLENLYRNLPASQYSEAGFSLCRDDDYTYIYVCTSARYDFRFDKLRATLTEILELPSVKIVQVVGDSGTSFSLTGSNRALDVLEKRMSPNVVIEYGATSHGQDSAWVVNESISRPKVPKACAFGNIVAASVSALKAKWTISPLVKVFVLLYDSTGTPTTFGDDTWLSDGLLDSSYKDELLCLEGGVQAFHQAVNVLCNSVSVFACAGLRGDSQRFSAAQLLLLLKGAEMNDGVTLADTLTAYFSTLNSLNPVNREKIILDAQRLRSVTALDELINAA